MHSYKCKNIELKLKYRVVMGVVVFLTIFFLTFLCASDVLGVTNLLGNRSCYYLVNILLICSGVVFYIVWIKYYRDLKGGVELEKLEGKVVGLDNNVALLSTENGLDAIPLSLRIIEFCDVSVGKDISITYCKNSKLIVEVNILQ